MSIRTKLALTLFLAVGLFLGMDMLLLRKSGASSFAALEQARCETQVVGIRKGFDAAYGELAGLAQQASLLASTPEELIRVRGDKEEFEQGASQEQADEPKQSSREQEAIAELMAIERAEAMDDSDLAATLDEHGTVLSYRYRNANGSLGVLRDVPNEQVSNAHPFMKTWLSGTPPRGLLETDHGLMLIGSVVGSIDDRPVLHVRGRRLDDAGLGRVQGLAGSTFECRSLREELLNSAAGEVPLPGETGVREVSDQKLVATALLDDIRGIPVAVLKTPVIRNERQSMEAMQRQEFLTALGVAIIFPLVLLILMQIVVTGPLGRLTEHASAIGKSNDAHERLNLARTDEIGVLAAEFDRMLDELELSRRAQQRVARMSGRSDVATGVMHGVGNLVNSVNVSAQLASTSIATLAVEDLRAILGALSKNAGNLDAYLSSDPQGQHLLEFFGAALDGLEAKVEGASREVSAVVRTVDEVTSLVQSLRSEESREVVVERVDMGREVEASIERCGLHETHLNIQCRVVIQPNIEVRLDRQRLEEILDAVLINARESLQSVGATARSLNVRVSTAGDQTVRVSVEDTGVGIPSNDLESIFGLNVTTKGEGRGRGLHMASIGAQELDGELHAWSAGEGEGAILTLEIPLEASNTHDAAATAQRS